MHEYILFAVQFKEQRPFAQINPMGHSDRRVQWGWQNRLTQEAPRQSSFLLHPVNKQTKFTRP